MKDEKLINVHSDLVSPVCALEEYVMKNNDTSPIVEVISMAFRKILDDIENGKYEVKR